jgi:ribosomal-protein-alanine N-acetyltransferase
MNKTFPKLESERLILRQILDSDLENVYKGLSHPEVIKYYGVSFHSLEATKEQMEWFADLEKNGTGIWWAVCSQETGEFLGAGGLNDLDMDLKKAEIGFWLLPEYWGKGYMTEAMPLILDHSFNSIGLRRIEGFVETENKNCINALQKLNFTYEETKENFEVKNGVPINIAIYTKNNLPTG